MAHFPMFVNLKSKKALVIGGGKVALRKIEKLRSFDPKIRVIAPEICDEIQDVEIKRRTFRGYDLLWQPEIVIAATDDQALNRKIARLCRMLRIPVNVVDDPDHGTFLFPATVTRGDFSAGICTGGTSPTAAVFFKEKLESQLPDNLEEMLRHLGAERSRLKEEIPDEKCRASALRQMFYEQLGEEDHRGSVTLVGAGCGKADLITIRGWNCLRRCDAVVYDDLIDPDLLDLVPESAQRIYMGKRSGAHSAPQQAINEELIRLAKKGLRVVRLKGGDPYLFGRGGEEMLALKEAGISCTQVPGITSAMGIPAEFGIPITHRGLSRGVHIVTAHTMDTPDGLPEDFDVLAQLDGTLVFLMGLGQLPKIADRLMAAGKDDNTPAAVLSGGNSKHPMGVRGPLKDIARIAAGSGIAAPAIILVGAVADLDLTVDFSHGHTV